MGPPASLPAAVVLEREPFPLAMSSSFLDPPGTRCYDPGGSGPETPPRNPTHKGKP